MNLDGYLHLSKHSLDQVIESCIIQYCSTGVYWTAEEVVVQSDMFCSIKCVSDFEDSIKNIYCNDF